MSTEGYRPQYKSEDELKAILSKAISGSAEAGIETFHARFDHLERGISLDDVIFGLKQNWSYERTPEFNEAEWQWKYRIKTETIDGDELTIIIAVDTVQGTFEVLTRWKPRE